MQFEVASIAPGVSLIVLSGRADAAAVDGVEAALSAHIRQAEGHVVLDLAGVPFMGSLGIRLLITLARVVARRSARIAMTGVQPQVLEVFETMALLDLIPHAPDHDAALALLAG